MIEYDAFLTGYCLVMAFVIGCVFGSFLHCYAWRTTHGESVMKGRSHCPECNHVLGPIDLIPILSWIFLGGKCRYCGKKVPVKYPISELVLGILSMLIILRFGISLVSLRNLIFAYTLFALTLTDLYDYLIPDACILIAIINWLVFAFFCYENLVVAGFTLLTAILFAVCLLGIVLLFDKILGKESMGGGDIKLVFVCALYLGFFGTMFMLILACMIGLIFAVVTRYRKSNENGQFPFGPALALATMIMMLYGEPFIMWYRSLY